jgi:hypothetical protein
MPEGSAELIDPLVVGVDDVEIARTVERNRPGGVELAGRRTGGSSLAGAYLGANLEGCGTGVDAEAEGLYECAVGVKDADPLIVGLGHVDPAGAIERDSGRVIEPSCPRSGRADDA